MLDVLNIVNDAIWGYFLVAALVGCGLWFTFRMRFVQFRMIGEMLRLLIDSAGWHKGTHHKHISSFQAFCVSLASRIGTGNLAGVATAIVVGGPGAVFWMWVMALFGAATAFVECTLAQLYKQRHKDSFIGGPAYYIRRGLHNPWVATVFALLMAVTLGLANNSVQSNTIVGAFEGAFGWNPVVVGIFLTLFTLVVVFGGIHRIARVSSILVPIMAVAYMLLALVIVVLNIQLVPHVFRVIIESAFGLNQVVGGTVGAAIMNGVKRGLFSNEAGEGSAPNAAATATVSHPIKQGLIQALGVFTDTLLVCSCTAFIILISGLYNDSQLNGIQLTQVALVSEVGSWGKVFVAMAILLFAYSSIIGNYYYGESNVRFVSADSKHLLNLYRIFSGGVMVMFGALTTLEMVWAIVDFFMALLAICNLIAIVLLGKYVFLLLNDYQQQRRQGVKDPVFHRSQLPEIENDIPCWE